MSYSYNGNIFDVRQQNGQFKLYYKAINKWSSGWAYIGTFKSRDKAEAAARQYSN